MSPKRLGQGLEKPLQRKNAPLLRPRLMNFPVSARDQMFQITARLGLRRKRRDPGQVGGGALVQLMEPLHLLERERQVRRRFHAIEHRFQLGPKGPPVFDESL
jgi:hypothetical protein